MKNLSFIEKIDSEIQKHHLLNHSFYKAWNEGALEQETINTINPKNNDIFVRVWVKFLYLLTSKIHDFGKQKSNKINNKFTAKKVPK